MKIKGLRSICGNVNLRKNEIKDIDEARAQKLVKLGYAEFVEAPRAEKTEISQDVKTAPKKRKSTKKTEAQDG